MSAVSVPVWSRSVGGMKCQLSALVRPKSTPATAPPSSTDNNDSSSQKTELNDRISCDNSEPSVLTVEKSSGGGVMSAGLAGLGAYSSTSSSDTDDNEQTV